MLPQTNDNNAHISTLPVCTHVPFFWKRDLVPPDFNDNFGACVQTGGIEIYTLLSVVCGNIFIHYW